MRNLVLFSIFVGVASLAMVGAGPALQSQGPCIPTVHYVVEDLGPLHSPGLAQLPSPAGSLPLPEPWLQRCQLANVGTMNDSKDVVFTSVTVQGSRIYLADDQGLSVVADGTAIACHLGDDGFVSGRDASGMALWYPASSAYHLYPYPITPPWAQPSSGILSGTSPKAHHVLQPGGLVQVVPAGSYLDNSGTLDSLLGTWRQELSQVTSPNGQQLFLNGALGTSEGIAVFGSAADAGWRPFYMTGSFTGFDPAVFHPLASTGAVHAMNESGATVGCARFPHISQEPLAFQEGVRFQEGPDDGLVGQDPEVIRLLGRSLEQWSCLHAINRFDIAGGTIGGTYGLLWSQVSGATTMTNRTPSGVALQVPLTHGGRELQILSIRGVHDDGTLAAIAILGDQEEEDDLEFRAVRLHPTRRLESVEILNADGVYPPTGLPIIRGDTVRTRMTVQAPINLCPGFRDLRVTFYGTHENDQYMGTFPELLKVSDLTVDSSTSYPNLETPQQRTIGFELNATRREVSFHVASRTELRCADGVDNDLDGAIDCFDDDCDGRECRTAQGVRGKCINFLCVPFEYECADGLDNDQDGLIDCQDPDCDRQLCGFGSRYCYLGLCLGPPHESGCYPWEPTGQCPWRCGNGMDDDENGPADCEDPDCDGLSCYRQGSACVDEVCTETQCDDNLDNDNDQLVDCEDPDCDGQPCGNGAICSWESMGCVEVICWDRLDNDGNELIDCDDPSCEGEPCADGAICVNKRCVEWTCTDGHDNDGDFRIDCDDPDCERRPCGDGGAECIRGRCVEQECWDGKDNDGRGLTDCADPDCDGRLCEVKGLFGVCWERQCIPCEDCADHRCADAPCGHGLKCKKKCEPAEFDCSNGIDDDGDGFTDCLDDDCDGSACLTSAGTWGTCIRRVCM